MAHPSRYSFEPLAILIPDDQRLAWRERVLEVVGRAPLEERMELLLVLQEPDPAGGLGGPDTGPGSGGLEPYPGPAGSGLGGRGGDPGCTDGPWSRRSGWEWAFGVVLPDRASAKSGGSGPGPPAGGGCCGGPGVRVPHHLPSAGVRGRPCSHHRHLDRQPTGNRCPTGSGLPGMFSWLVGANRRWTCTGQPARGPGRPVP